MVVLAVTVVLTMVMFPAFQMVRESARRVACATNQKQIGFAIALYADDHSGRLPPTQLANGPLCRPQEMMACSAGPFLGSAANPLAGPWDGLGWLVAHGSGYLSSPKCLYCPSHRGEHEYERYEDRFRDPSVNEVIYTNYHYFGDRKVSVEDTTPRRFQNSHAEILLTDGMRTKRDYNHVVGANVLRGDISVRWYEDAQPGPGIRNLLPDGQMSPGAPQVEKYKAVWDQVVKVQQDVLPAEE